MWLDHSNEIPHPYGRAFREDIDAFVRRLHIWATSVQRLQIQAYTLTRKRRTRVDQDRPYWIAQGRRETLMRALHTLKAMLHFPYNTCLFYFSVKEYISILEKWSTDAEEGSRRQRQHIELWKAEGEAQELPKITHALSTIVQAYIPDVVGTVSLDGKSLVNE